MASIKRIAFMMLVSHGSACSGETSDSDVTQMISRLCGQIAACPESDPPEECRETGTRNYESAKAQGCSREFEAVLNCWDSSDLECDVDGGADGPDECEPLERALDDCYDEVSIGLACAGSGARRPANEGSVTVFCDVQCEDATVMIAAQCQLGEEGYDCECVAGERTGTEFSISDCDTIQEVALKTCD